MRRLLLLFLFAVGAAHAQTATLSDFALVSMTDPNTAKLVNKNLCYSDGFYIVCDGAAGTYTTSGTLSVVGISASGNISAGKFIGDGSLLTGIGGGGGGATDRITSDTSNVGVFANQTGFISFTTGGVTTGYFNSAGLLTAPGISLTTHGISSTTGYF